MTTVYPYCRYFEVRDLRLLENRYIGFIRCRLVVEARTMRKMKGKEGEGKRGRNEESSGRREKKKGGIKREGGRNI